MPTPSLDALRQLVPLAWQGRPQSYGVERLYATLSAHEEGDFSESGILGRLLLRDDRIGSCVETRVNALLGCTQTICGAEIEDDTEEEAVRDAVAEWWPKVVTEQAITAIETDKLVHAVAFAELVWDRRAKSWQPSELRHWSVDAFRWDDWRDCYVVRTRDGGEQEVRHGDGRWVVYEPYGRHGWHRGLLLALADKWLMRQWDFRDWARLNEKLGQGVFKAVVPRDTKDPDRLKFLQQVARIGANSAIAVPRGESPGSSYDLELLSFDGKGFETFEAFSAALNVAIAVRVLGQNLTTEAQGGSYAAANVQDRVRGDLLKSDTQLEGTVQHTGICVPWTTVNKGDPDLAPWPTRKTALEPPEDEKAKADTRKVQVDTIAVAASLSPRVDVDKALEECGFELLDESEVEKPDLPPPPSEDRAPDGAAEPPPPQPTAASRVRLAQPAPNAAFIAGQRWVDGLVAGATLLGQPTIDQMVKQVAKAVKASATFEEMRTRLVLLAAEAPTPEAEELFERAILLAVGQGTSSGTTEIDVGP